MEAAFFRKRERRGGQAAGEDTERRCGWTRDTILRLSLNAEGKNPADGVENWGALDETGLGSQSVWRRRCAVIMRGGAVRTVGRGQRTWWQLAGGGEPPQRQGFWGMATRCREQGCPGTPEDGMVDGGGLGNETGGLVPHKLPCECASNRCLCLSLLPAGRAWRSTAVCTRRLPPGPPANGTGARSSPGSWSLSSSVSRFLRWGAWASAQREE